MGNLFLGIFIFIMIFGFLGWLLDVLGIIKSKTTSIGGLSIAEWIKSNYDSRIKSNGYTYTMGEWIQKELRNEIIEGKKAFDWYINEVLVNPHASPRILEDFENTSLSQLMLRVRSIKFNDVTDYIISKNLNRYSNNDEILKFSIRYIKYYYKYLDIEVILKKDWLNDYSVAVNLVRYFDIYKYLNVKNKCNENILVNSFYNSKTPSFKEIPPTMKLNRNLYRLYFLNCNTLDLRNYYSKHLNELIYLYENKIIDITGLILFISKNKEVFDYLLINKNSELEKSHYKLILNELKDDYLNIIKLIKHHPLILENIEPQNYNNESVVKYIYEKLPHSLINLKPSIVEKYLDPNETGNHDEQIQHFKLIDQDVIELELQSFSNGLEINFIYYLYNFDFDLLKSQYNIAVDCIKSNNTIEELISSEKTHKVINITNLKLDIEFRSFLPRNIKLVKIKTSRVLINNIEFYDGLILEEDFEKYFLSVKPINKGEINHE
jgi:hypothetical protein